MSFAASTSTATKFTTHRNAAFSVPLNVRPRSRTVNTRRIVCASQKHETLVAPTVAASIAASLFVPDIAAATTLTPSVQALLNSVVAGGILAGLILGTVTLVARFDPVVRK